MKGAIKGEEQMDYTFGRRDLGERKKEREGGREGGRGNCPKVAKTQFAKPNGCVSSPTLFP